ncbi:MAG: HupE/UreJ family protein [Xanthobacteraceae bacterium]
MVSAKDDIAEDLRSLSATNRHVAEIEEMTARLQRAVLLCLWLFRPATASAHLLGDGAGGFSSGFKHPITGLDHVVAMVSVGLWGAQLGAPAIWLLPVTFPMVMAFGGMLALIGVPLPGTEIGIALSAIGLGAVVATEAKPALWVAALLVGFFAIFHGHAHGTELPPDESGVLYSIGFVVATGLLHLTGIGIGLIHRWKSGQIVLRFGGVGVVVAGAVSLWNALI